MTKKIKAEGCGCEITLIPRFKGLMCEYFCCLHCPTKNMYPDRMCEKEWYFEGEITGKTSLGNDYRSHVLPKKLGKKLFDQLTQKNCTRSSCNESHVPIVHYWQHEGGWQTDLFNEKVWLYFECPKCHYGEKISRLGIKGHDIKLLE